MLERWKAVGNYVELYYPEGMLTVTRGTFNRAFMTLTSAKYEDVKKDFHVENNFTINTED